MRQVVPGQSSSMPIQSGATVDSSEPSRRGAFSSFRAARSSASDKVSISKQKVNQTLSGNPLSVLKALKGHNGGSIKKGIGKLMARSLTPQGVAEWAATFLSAGVASPLVIRHFLSGYFGTDTVLKDRSLLGNVRPFHKIYNTAVNKMLGISGGNLRNQYATVKDALKTEAKANASGGDA